jgi:PhoPQ-activated pathogenicity-related protein
VDPYTFRDRLTMPKLFIIATNDRYWPPDALQFYGPELPQPWSVFYAANAQHNLDKNYVPVMFAAGGFARRVLTGTEPPQVSLTATAHDGHRILTCSLSAGEFLKPGADRTAKLWYTTSEKPDLREAKWESIPMESNPTGFSAELPPTPGKTTYAFAELALGDSHLPLKITTTIWRDEAVPAIEQKP